LYRNAVRSGSACAATNTLSATVRAGLDKSTMDTRLTVPSSKDGTLTQAFGSVQMP
jgi:hypothetical protein